MNTFTGVRRLSFVSIQAATQPDRAELSRLRAQSEAVRAQQAELGRLREQCQQELGNLQGAFPATACTMFNTKLSMNTTIINAFIFIFMTMPILTL